MSNLKTSPRKDQSDRNVISIKIPVFNDLFPDLSLLSPGTLLESHFAQFVWCAPGDFWYRSRWFATVFNFLNYIKAIQRQNWLENRFQGSSSSISRFRIPMAARPSSVRFASLRVVIRGSDFGFPNSSRRIRSELIPHCGSLPYMRYLDYDDSQANCLASYLRWQRHCHELSSQQKETTNSSNLPLC